MNPWEPYLQLAIAVPLTAGAVVLPLTLAWGLRQTRIWFYR